MSTKTFRVYHKQRYDTLEAWETANPVLLTGEIAVCVYSGAEGDEPSVYVKIGDGVKNFVDLPFLTAKAGDVYAWAKSATKPTYTASEIGGLADYIAGLVDPDTNTRYRIIQGDDAKTFKFQSQELGDTTWTDAFTLHIPDDITYTLSSDTAGKVTLTPSTGNPTEVTVITIDSTKDDITATSTGVPTSAALVDYIDSTVGGSINDLDSPDTAVTGQFVTEVSEEDGIISVKRAKPVVADISDLVFNSTYDKDTNKAATMADVEASSARVFRFKGIVATVDDLPGTDNDVGDTYHVKADKGEYTWVSKTDDEGNEVFEWELLGGEQDLSTFVTKDELSDALDLKQDLITPTNKLSSALVSGNATTTQDGLMSKEDKAKLDGIQEGAEANKIEKVIAGDTLVPIVDKTVTLSKLAYTGNVMDVLQDDDNVVILDGGNAFGGNIETVNTLILDGGISDNLD